MSGGASNSTCCSAATAAFVLLLLLQLRCGESQNAIYGSETYSFPYFDNSFGGTNLTVTNDALISSSSQALQLTPDSLNQPTYLVNKSGRILFNQRFKLWDYTKPSNSSATPSNNKTKYAASFSTFFAINIFRPINAIPGEGFAFIIAPTLDPAPAQSFGGFLGLTNATSDGNATNQLFAVELDTFKQPYDIDDNHVGLDVNSVKSTVSQSLTPFGIEISPNTSTGSNYTVWVDYNGTTRHIWVYMALNGEPKPKTDVLNSSIDLSDTINQYSYFGFSASTGNDYELNCVLNWTLTVEILPDKKGLAKWKLGLIIGIPVFVALAAGLVAGLYIIRRKRVRDDPTVLTGTMIRSLPGTPKEFDFKELRKATNNFDEKMKLGQGGFGVVYKGVLPGDDGKDMVVAVKQFSRSKTKGQEDFLWELSIINRLRHRHLVRLLGWCHKNGVLLLVYDFMPNGSLDQHLFGGPDKPILNWERRYNIITGVAAALHYLHNEYDQMVVHRDLKASNVMLDSAFNARLGDFGLARALETDKTSYAEVELNGVPGTLGYIAPECFHTGKATRESDIFGFGAVILETVCGRQPRCEIAGFHFLVDWVWKLYREGRILEAVDPRLSIEFIEDDAERLLLLGLMCSHPTPAERPKSQAIVQIISRSVPPPDVPPFKPAFVMPAAEPDEQITGSSQLNSTGVNSSYTASTSWTNSSYVSKERQENDVSMV